MTEPIEPGTPPPNLELTLAQRANEAMRLGADPTATTARLHQMLQHLRANPTIAQEGTTALAQGADPDQVSGRMWDITRNAIPSARADATAAQPRTSGPYLLPNLRDLAIDAVKEPIRSAFDAALSPSVGEARPNPNLSKGGNSANQPLNQPPYDAEHGAVTPARRFQATVQTAANIAAPTIAKIPYAGVPLSGATVGASYDPEHPLVGAGVGSVAASVLHATPKILGKGVSAVLDATGARPESYTGTPTFLKSAARVLGVQSQEQQADRIFSTAARASGITPEAASSVPVESPTTALDLAQPGSPLHRVVRQAWNVPTSTAQPTLRGFYADRAAGTGERIQGALTDASGVVPTDTDLPVEARIEKRAAEAKPLYQKAYAHGPIQDPETIAQIQSLLKNPTFAKAWGRGKTLMELDGETPGPTANGEALSPENAAQLQKMGLDKVVPQSGPTVQQIDYWKKGLDAQIEAGAGSDNALSRTEARTYRQKLSGVLKRVDTEVPDYAAARQNFAGHSDLLEASQAGADHFSPSASASYLQRTLPERFPTAGEQQEYNTNAINAFVQKVRNLAANPDLPASARGTNLVQRLMGTADAGAKLRMLFPDDAAYQGFIRRMEQEASYPKTAGFFTSQSSTAGQLAESKSDPRLWLDVARAPFSNNAKMNLAMRALNADSKMSPSTANFIGQRATQTGPPMQSMVDNRFLKAAKKTSSSRALSAAGAGIAGRKIGPENP